MPCMWKTAQDVGSHRTPSRFTNLPEGNISLEINNDKPTPSQLFWVPATKVGNYFSILFMALEMVLDGSIHKDVRKELVSVQQKADISAIAW